MDGNKKCVIVLGGIAAHKELIVQLKKMGYFTLLIDYFDNPPAKCVADLHIKESTLDKDTVLGIAKKWNVSAILSGCVDQANITACYVSEKLGLYTPYSYDVAMRITDKEYMKKVMLEQGILTSRYFCVKSVDEVIGMNLQYPIMIKPADCNSTNGVKKAKSWEEVQEYLGQALQISRSGKAIVEEYVEGKEINVYLYICDKKSKLIMTAERISAIEGKDKVIKCYAAIVPARISKKLELKAETIADKIARAFDLNNTFFFFQGIVAGDDINVIEFAPRVGGGAGFRTIPLNTGLDIIDALIKSSFGEKPNFSRWHYPTNVLAVNTIYAKDCIFDHVEGHELLLERQEIADFFMYKTKGMRIDNRSASGGRIGAFIVKGENENDILHSVRRAYDILSVRNSEGEEVLRADLNLYAMRGTY